MTVGAVHNVDWGKQIIYKSRTDTTQISGSENALHQRDDIRDSRGKEKTDGMIVFVDKIANCPIAAGVDNYVENMSYQIQLVLAGDTGNTCSNDSGGGGDCAQVQSVLGSRARAKLLSSSSSSSPPSSSSMQSKSTPLLLPEVYLSSRLDVCTSGVVPLTTTAQVVSTTLRNFI